MWNIVGLTLACLTCAFAWYRSVSRRGFYDGDVYGMAASAHRLYAAGFLAFAFFFAAAQLLHLDTAGLYALALYALIAIFYATSFLRGAPDDE